MRRIVTTLAALAMAACGSTPAKPGKLPARTAQPENQAVPEQPGSTSTGSAVAGPVGDTSYAPVALTESFDSMYARLVEEKPVFQQRQQSLLEQRYDLSDRPHPSVTMSNGKAVQTGVRAKLKDGLTWESFAALSPAQIRERDLFPYGYRPLPHAKHKEGGQVIPQFHIDEIERQEGRDLKRFDIDFDLADHFLPEFPPPIYLTTRPDLGDVSQGKLVTNQNFFEMFNGILTPRQIEGLRLLTIPFAQQQFNLTDDRRVVKPQLGIACFDCHSNGSTNAAFHLDPTTRPQEARRRIDTPTLRGVNVQRLFGSQRALKTVEDFTEFEQLGAYFDGDHVAAAKKGINKLDRSLQVAMMAEFQSILDFPPAPKLDEQGKLDPVLATEQELRGEALFSGKARCVECHAPPHYTDNNMHNLKVERFFKPEIIHDQFNGNDGPIKTFPLRGIKDTPPYLHDGRLLTLEDTVEFFNIVMELKLTKQEKEDLTTFLYTL